MIGIILLALWIGGLIALLPFTLGIKVSEPKVHLFIFAMWFGWPFGLIGWATGHVRYEGNSGFKDR